MTPDLPTAAQVDRLLNDDSFVDQVAGLLTTPDPEASPAVSAARLRFTGGEVRAVLGAVGQVLITNESSD